MTRLLTRLLTTLMLICAALSVGCDAGSQPAGYRVVAKYPHDRNAYTQGLLIHDGLFYESTGLRGRSSLRLVEPESGRVLRRRDLDPRLFGEGLAKVGNELIQLTWTHGVAIAYAADSFVPLRTYRYNTQGWGLTFDGKRLIMSDGSDKLYFRDPLDFSLQGSVAVRDGASAVNLLNELEYIDGAVWANVYQSNDIVRIDPASGSVIGRLDFSDLLAEEDRYGGEDVLNGIAWDAERRQLFLTGKLYAFVYQIELR